MPRGAASAAVVARPFVLPLFLSLAAVLAGCASGGSELPASTINTGSVQPARLLIPDAERNATCVAIENSMKSQVARIRTLEVAVEAERKAAAPTIVRTFTRMFGPADADNKSLAELREEEARLVAFNDLLAEKGCSRLDLVALKKSGNLAQINIDRAGPAEPVVSIPTGVDVPGLEKILLPRGY